MEILNIYTIYTIDKYKNEIHRMHDTVKVYSKSGKVFYIGKSKSVYYLGKKAFFELNATDYRRSKFYVINYLKAKKKF